MPTGITLDTVDSKTGRKVVSSEFGNRSGGFHAGIDIANPWTFIDEAAPGFGHTPTVHVVREGKVKEIFTAGSPCGNGILIDHYVAGRNTPAFATGYCHLRDPISGEFKIGDKISAGTFIGFMGNTGTHSTGVHLHFTVRQYTGLNQNFEYLDPRPFLNSVYGFNSVKVNNVPANTSQPNRNASAISPNIGSMESFHPRIQFELTQRRLASNTAKVYMPFVKLTSLSAVLNKHLGKGNTTPGTGSVYFPSLGTHGQNIEKFDDIYSPIGEDSYIGWAIGDGPDRNQVKVLVESSATETTDQAKVPIPGIISAKAERSTAGPMGVRGGLMKIDLTIRAHSKGQVDALLVYFLRPATRLVLEFGRISSDSNEHLSIFDWKRDKNVVINEFKNLLIDRTYQEQFAKKYVYASNGNYEIFLGYVVKFNLKYTKDNVYEIDLTLHSVQQYETPTTQTAVTSTCKSPIGDCDVVDIMEYFNEDAGWKNNTLVQLMSSLENENRYSEWKNEVVSMRNENKPDEKFSPGKENDYYVTWRFFMEMILHNRTYGIASMFANEKLILGALPRLVYNENTALTDSKLVANEVGYHPALRSTDPNVMIIYNNVAQSEADSRDDIPQDGQIETLFTNVATAYSGSVDFDQIPKNNIETVIRAGRSFAPHGQGTAFLDGIWISTAAIKQAFSSADTVSSGMSALLSMMNRATQGYWNLQLYSTDHGMYVIDMGLSKAPAIVNQYSNRRDWIDAIESSEKTILDSQQALTHLPNYYEDSVDTPKYLYMFNRRTKFLSDGSGELGSDLIDLKVEFNMPQVIAVQAIANIGGSAQKGLLQSIDIEELQSISLLNDLYNVCDDSGLCKEEPCVGSNALAGIDAKIRQANSRWRAAGAGGLTREAGRTQREIEKEQQELLSKRQQVIKQLDAERAILNGNFRRFAVLITKYGNLGSALQLVEPNASRMLKKLNFDSENDTAAGGTQSSGGVHAFNSSNLTKTLVDVTLPGIGGIELFQAFLVDRAPSILERGYYVVTKVNHEFESNSGWITKIQGRFRFRPAFADERRNVSTDPCKDTPNS